MTKVPRLVKMTLGREGKGGGSSLFVFFASRQIFFRRETKSLWIVLCPYPGPTLASWLESALKLSSPAHLHQVDSLLLPQLTREEAKIACINIRIYPCWEKPNGKKPVTYLLSLGDYPR